MLEQKHGESLRKSTALELMRRWCLFALAIGGLGACHAGAMHGLVLGDDGAPVARAEVRTDARVVTTAPDGAFEFTSTSIPYDAVVVVGGNRFTIYKGLTRKDPILYAGGAKVGTRHLSQVAGTLVGGSGFPVDPSMASVAVALDVQFGFGFADGGTGGFSMNGGWAGGLDTVRATLRALERSPGSGVPSVYLAYGEQTVTLANGVPLGGVQIALKPVATAHASGHLSLPPSSRVSALSFDVVLDAVALDSWFDPSPSSTSSFSVPMPDIPGAAVRVQADAFGITGGTRVWRFLRPGMTDVNVDVPAAPVLLSPGVGATDLLRSSALSWTNVPGAVYVLDVDAPDASAPHFRVVTSGTSTLLSDLDSLTRLPATTSITWRVTAIGPFTDLDSTASSAGFSSVAQLALRGLSQPSENRFNAPSSGQAFTLKP